MRSDLNDQEALDEDFERIAEQVAAVSATSRESRLQMVRSALRSAWFESKSLGSRAPFDDFLDDMSKLMERASTRFDDDVKTKPMEPAIQPPRPRSPDTSEYFFGINLGANGGRTG